MRKSLLTLLSVMLAVLGIGSAGAQEKALKVVSVADASGATNLALLPNSENVASMKQTVVLENTGDVDLQPGDPQLSITLYDTARSLDLATVPVNVAIPAGESVDYTVDWSFSLDPIVEYEAKNITYFSGYYYSTFGVRDNVSSTTARESSSRYVYPYVVHYSIAELSRPYDVTPPYAFGFCTEPTTLTYRFYNRGGAPLVITGIDFPEGFSTSVELPLTVPVHVGASDPSRLVEFPIIFSPDHGGIYGGDIVIHAQGAEDKTYAVSGVYPDADAYLEDFESGDAPGWIISSEHSYIARPGGTGKVLAVEKTFGTYQDRSAGAQLAISPKLHFNEGEKLFFEANQKGTSYSYIGVAISPDRANWQTIATVTPYNSGGDFFFDTNYQKFTGCTVEDIPAGDWYIGFFMGYSRIDNVMGGVLADVNYDLYATTSAIDATGTVNHPFGASITLKNMSREVPASAYSVALYMAPKPESDDVEAVYAKMAEMPVEDVFENGSVDLSTTFMPHASGNFLAYIGIEIDGQLLRTPVVEVGIAPESSTELLAIGVNDTSIAQSNRNYAPIRIYDKNSSSQTLYLASELAEYGLKEGAKIAGVVYRGYSTADKTITGNMFFNMRAYEASTITPSTSVVFTEVMASQSTFDVRKSNTYYDFIDMAFTKPFTYEGGNLVIEVRSEDQSAFGYMYFEQFIPSSTASRFIYKSNDTKTTWQKASYNQGNTACGIPVVYFKVEKEPIYLSGTVTWQDEPVAGAQVLIDADGVQYTATTDEEGNYQMQVYQGELDYNVTVVAEGHPRYTGTETVTLGTASLTHDIALRDWPTLSGSVKDAEGNGVVAAPITLSYGEYSRTFTADEEGNFSEKMDFIDADPFTVTVDDPDHRVFTGEVSLYDGLDKTLNVVLEDFTFNREYPVTIHVSDVRGTSLEGVSFNLRSELKDLSYASEETTLDADGNCTVNVYGGEHTFTLNVPYMAAVTHSFKVNKPVSLEFTLNEAVNTPAGFSAQVSHNAYTGQNDLLLSWGDAPANLAHRVPTRSTANPAEVFVISLDGKEVGTTEDYNYMIENVAAGTHTVALYAKYTAQQSEATELSVTINAKDYVAAKFRVSTNNDLSADGIRVDLAGEEATYQAVVEDGLAEVPYLPVGEYLVSISAPYYQPWSKTISYTAKLTTYVDLMETLAAPFGLTAQATENPDMETFSVDMKWNVVPGFFDSFDEYEAFATAPFGDWTGSNLSTEPSYELSIGTQTVTFPGCSTTASPVSVEPMVFNPADTEPSMIADSSMTPASGSQMLVFMGAENAVADKWIYAPAIEVLPDYALSFQAKAYSFYNESIEVCISTDSEHYEVIETINPRSGAWQTYSYSLTPYVGEEVKVALHYVARDGMLCMVDDFKIGNEAGESIVAIGHVTGYDILLDDEAAAETSETSYTLPAVPAGNHVVGVRARYASGASEVTSYPLTLTSGVDVIAADTLVGDIVTPAGVVVKRAATAADVRALDKGIYIIGGKKVVVK